MWVVAVASHEATPNRRAYLLQEELDGKDDTDICYRTQNLSASSRFIFFFADAPHIKRVRNCLYNSVTGHCTRYMWNVGKYLLWQHIVQVYQDGLENGLKILPKLTRDDVYPTPFSVMTVKYAVQILSKTMSVALSRFETPESTATAKYCEMIDSFLDCLNVRSLSEGSRKIKPLLEPYVSQNDDRFTWLIENCLDYLNTWKESIETRPGNFTATAKTKMFVSYQTHQDFKITCYSTVDCVKFLLQEGMEYVLTEQFSQDALEEYFGNQRKIGRRSENPDAKEFGYNDNTIRIQRNVSHTSRNTR